MQTTEKDMTTPAAQLDELQAKVAGEVIAPGHAHYDEARGVWNGYIDKKPAAIVRARGPSDVAEAVKFSRAQGLRVSARGGGHNVAGNAVNDGGLVIDLSGMRGVRVDPERRTVRAQGGAQLGDIDRESQVLGLAVPVGVVSETGVSGLTLGGGYGWMRRKYGMTCDNLVSADVVTADGRLITASETENADLFWALRGGGGGFGIVTSLEYQAYPLGPQVFFTFVFHPYEEAREGLRFFREFAAQAPPELGLLAVFATVPEHGPFPEASKGRRSLAFVAAYAGPPDEGEHVLRPVREFSTPLADLSGVMPWVEAQKALDEDYPSGRRYYWKSMHLKGLDDETIDRLVEHGGTYPSPLTTIDIWHNGGAIRTPRSETAFANRDAEFMVTFESNWTGEPDDGANIGWTRAAYKDMEPLSTGGRYLNFPGFFEEGDDLRQAAAGQNFERVQAIKKRYDPDGLFKTSAE